MNTNGFHDFANKSSIPIGDVGYKFIGTFIVERFDGNDKVDSCKFDAKMLIL